MKLFVNLQTTGDLVIEHRGQRLEYRAIKSVEQKDFDIFKEINEYWAACTPEKQDAIFQAYKDVHAVFTEYVHLGLDFDISELLPRLRPLIANLFEYHKQEDIHNWYKYNSNIGIPSNIPDTYNESEGRPGTRDQTYDKADYERLIVLSVSIRCMIPVWGEFIIRTENELGNQLKEYWALTLLRESNVMNCLAMVRLRRYIDAMISRAPIDLGVSLKVTSIHNFNDWMLGLTAVRRLTRGDLRIGVGNTNLAAFIYGFLRMKLEGMNGQIGEVKDKKPISSTGDGENNLSDLEGFRIKETVPTGDVMMPPEYLRWQMNLVLDEIALEATVIPFQLDLFGLLTGHSSTVLEPLPKLLHPAADIRPLIKQAYHQTRYLSSEIIEDPQLLLCGFLLSDHISVRAIPHMNKSDVQRLIAFSAATFWAYKQKDLACLVLSLYRHPLIEEKMARPADHYARISKDYAEQLKENFPFVRPGRGGKPQDSGSVLLAIELIVDGIKERDLHYNLPTPWERELGVKNGAVYHAPTKIRDLLADFIIRMNTVKAGQPLY